MKRETVKELLNLSDDTLKEIEFYGLIKHRDVAQYYVNGGDVESSVEESSNIYYQINNPKFQAVLSYRKVIPEIEVLGVKVRANPPLSLNDELPNKIFVLSSCAKNGYFETRSEYCSGRRGIKRGSAWANEDDIRAVVKALGWVSDENN